MSYIRVLTPMSVLRYIGSYMDPCCGFITRSLLFILTPMAVLSLVVPRFTKDDGGQVSDKLGVLNKDPCCGFHK